MTTSSLPAGTLPFSKTCAVVDFNTPAFARHAEQADARPQLLAGQHPIRRWEYTMAHYVLSEWQDLLQQEGRLDPPLRIADVGSAGSNFWHLLLDFTSADIELIDPAYAGHDVVGQVRVTPTDLVSFAANDRHGALDVLTAISVIEHIEQPDVRRFARAAAMLLKPGGLLFLTTDCWDADGPDCAHFHWMRKRIYNAESLRKLQVMLREVGFQSFGATDWTYHGHQVHNYSVASIAMRRR